MPNETLTTLVVKLRNQLQPTTSNNSDPALFDYLFFTDLEKLAKKERTKSKDHLKAMYQWADDFAGVVTETTAFILNRKLGKGATSFDKDAFIEAVANQWKIPKHELIMLASKTTKTGNPRETLEVIKK